MHIAEATELIWIDKISRDRAQTWCDLGCGTGTFTLALATLLSPGSVIHAIDKNEKSLSQIPDRYQEVTIHKEVVDLRENDLSLPALDGVLMANFLHFIEYQGAFLARLRFPVRAIAGCRIRRQGAKSMGTIPTQLLCLARLAPGTRIQ